MRSRSWLSGVYVECNAISPDRTRTVQRIIEKAGAHYVDGGIIGGPAWTREAKTHMYLSGPRAQEVAACFAGSPLRRRSSRSASVRHRP